MATTAQLQQFFMGLEQPNAAFFNVNLDKKSMYHDEALDSVIAIGQSFISSPKLKQGLEIFTPNIITLEFIHTSLFQVTIDKESANFGKVRAEDECDCYDESCDFPIHARITLVDGTKMEISLLDLIESTDDDYVAITDILKKYMPYSVLRELIESVDLKPVLTDEVINKLLWPKPYFEKN